MHTIQNVQSPFTQTDFWNQWGSPTPRMCTMVLITPVVQTSSVTTIGFTSNSRDMVMPGHPGIVFQAAPGLSPSAIEAALDEPPNLEVMAIYSTGTMASSDVGNGLWNFAEVLLFSACWDNVNLGEFWHVRGNLGKVADRQTYCNAEIRGIIQRLANDVHPITSMLCRAPRFGDPVLCKKDLTGTVNIGGTNYKLTESSIQLQAGTKSNTYQNIITSSFTGPVPPANYYANGQILCTAGQNAGISREIAYSAAASGGIIQVQLKRPFPLSITGVHVGPNTEVFTLIAGCKHTVEDCIKFGNIINRRAEDFIPGIESITRLPTQ